MTTKRRALVLCSHPPHKDPRIIWYIGSLKERFDVGVLYVDGFADGSSAPRQMDGVTHIVVDKRQDSEMKDWSYDFSEERKIAENENFVAYEVRSVTREPGLGESGKADDG